MLCMTNPAGHASHDEPRRSWLHGCLSIVSSPGAGPSRNIADGEGICYDACPRRARLCLSGPGVPAGGCGDARGIAGTRGSSRERVVTRLNFFVTRAPCAMGSREAGCYRRRSRLDRAVGSSQKTTTGAGSVTDRGSAMAIKIRTPGWFWASHTRRRDQTRMRHSNNEIGNWWA